MKNINPMAGYLFQQASAVASESAALLSQPVANSPRAAPRPAGAVRRNRLHLTPRTPKGCVALALTIVLAATSPPVHASEFDRPSEQAVVAPGQPRVPTTQDAPAMPRQQTQAPADDTGHVVTTAVITSVVGLIVSVLACGLVGVCGVTFQ